MPPLHNNPQQPLLGIDLGTTYSAIARWDGLNPQVYVDNLTGTNTTRSVVYLDGSGGDGPNYVVGQTAFQQTIINPENGCVGVKRLMDDKTHEIPLGAPPHSKIHSPIDLSAKILDGVYDNAAGLFPAGQFNPLGVVVTVPYYFKVNQRRNTRDAVLKAGLPPLLAIVDEPVAASLSYAWNMLGHNGGAKREKILVFDLGGGTFDVTLFDFTQDAGAFRFEVLATGGDDRLGGMDFDQRLYDYLVAVEGVNLDAVSDPHLRKSCRQNLLAGAEKAKETLAAAPNYLLAIPFVPMKKNPAAFMHKITRAELDDCVRDYTARVAHIVLETCLEGKMLPKGKNLSIDAVSDCLNKEGIAGLVPLFAGHGIDRVVRVGGSSNLLFFQNLLADLFGAGKVYGAANVNLAVVEGAALFAAYTFNPQCLGRNVQIIHRCSHPFGVETAGGAFSPLIEKNTVLPAKGAKTYQFGRDNVTHFDLNVYQGSSQLVKENAHVGTVHLAGLPPKPARALDVEVTFDMDSQGLVMVTVDVRDLSTGGVIMTIANPLATK